MSDWNIELLTSVADIEAILAIEDASFTNPWTREMYVSELQNHGVSYVYFAVAPPNRRIVGFCSCWLVVDELHINNLAVLPDRRRGGVATALLQHVFREAASHGAMRATLEVRRSNTPARLLYERFGFTTVGVRPGYYSTPVEDALVLWRENLVLTD